jgi:hypothetical protein
VVGVTTAGVIALARRHSQTPDESTSETPAPDAQAGAPDELTSETPAPDAQAGASGGEGTET